MVDLGVAPGLQDAQHCLQWSVGVFSGVGDASEAI